MTTSGFIMTNTLLLAAVVAALSAGAPVHAGAAADPAPVVLSEADAVKPAVLPVGATSTLRLESNPSTGFGWQVLEARNLRVEEPFAIEQAPASGVPIVGAPGTAVIRITPRGKGSASLALVYKQPWMETTSDDRVMHFVFDAQ
ncbi:MAG: protease inhibitor I42 family protein [Candidatus Brevundimonas colombiensis]|uniref:Protease inhibitor I42 family protein n=1 Tax=Candidatus Brevundimonas colombiensis TaxID=3121376 RepID=A0AAJ5X303_9CAUL|nr:protease inhibitor I42 family protein [Brevundimonas sp.]WEK41333.1 MAG: protease inhibitor I42 family protein [Brevundimonas sp.]